MDVEALDALLHAGDEGHLHQQSRQSHGRPARRRTLRAIVEVARKNDAWLHRRGVPPLEPDRRVRRVGRRTFTTRASPPAP